MVRAGFFVCCLLVFCQCPALAADSVGTVQRQIDEAVWRTRMEMELQQLREAAKVQSPEVATLGQRIEAQDKLIEQVGHQVDGLGSHIGIFSGLVGVGAIVIPVFLVLIGWFAYRDAERKAKEIAEQTSKKTAENWFSNNEADLRKQFLELLESVKQHHDNAVHEIDKQAKDFSNGLLDNKASDISDDIKSSLNDTDTNLQNKPEAQYTFEDWNIRAFSAYSQQKYALAAEYWKKAASVADATEEQIVHALFNQATVSGEYLKDTTAAVDGYDVLINRYGDSAVTGVQEAVAIAYYNKGVIQSQTDSQAAIYTYNTLIARYANSGLTDAQELVAKAYVNKGFAQSQTEPQAAIATYDALIAGYGDSCVAGIQEQVAKAYVNKGFAQSQTEPQAAIATYDALIAGYGDSDVAGMQEQVAKAYFNKGVVQSQADLQTAIATCDAMIARYGDSGVDGVQEQVASAYNGKGFALLLRGKQHWQAVESRRGDLDLALVALHTALPRIAAKDKGVVLGNIAYAEWLLGREPAGVAETLGKALRIGGAKLYQDTLEDTARFPVAEDADFRALVERVWAEVQAEVEQ